MTTVDTPAQPMSRRDVWLTVALAVAKGMPEPDQVWIRPALPDDNLPPHVTVTYSARGCYARPVDVVLHQATEAARILDLDGPNVHPQGIVWSWVAHGRQGWTWDVEASTPDGTLTMPAVPEPAPDRLAEQVIAAVGAA